MIGKRAAGAVVVSAAMVAGLVACDTGGAPGDGTWPGGGAPQNGGSSSTVFPRNAIVSAVCSTSSPGRAVVGVDGWDPESWKRVAHVDFLLPEATVLALDTDANRALRNLCEFDDAQDVEFQGVDTIRSLFDRDFTKMAVATSSPEKDATHVGYVDRSGAFTDLTGEEGFGLTPHEYGPALSHDGSTLWFISRTKHSDPEEGWSPSWAVSSRSLTGDHRATNRTEPGSAYDDSVLVTLQGLPGRVVTTSSAGVSPNGKRLLVDDYLVDTSAGGAVIDAAGGTGSDGWGICGESGRAAGWVNDDTVLCSTQKGEIVTTGTSSAATPSAPVLPANDYDNVPLVLSPNGRRFIFLAFRNQVVTSYVSDTRPGSTPQEIGRGGEFASLGDRALVIDWR